MFVFRIFVCVYSLLVIRVLPIGYNLKRYQGVYLMRSNAATAAKQEYLEELCHRSGDDIVYLHFKQRLTLEESKMFCIDNDMVLLSFLGNHTNYEQTALYQLLQKDKGKKIGEKTILPPMRGKILIRLGYVRKVKYHDSSFNKKHKYSNFQHYATLYEQRITDYYDYKLDDRKLDDNLCATFGSLASKLVPCRPDDILYFACSVKQSDNKGRICITTPIVGRWGSWQSWSQCTVTCGGGERKRFRYCSDPKPSFNAKNCRGKWNDVQNCGNDPCPLKGKWNEWSKWAVCSKSCGGGVRRRMRYCNSPSPKYGGVCDGSGYEFQSCLVDACPLSGVGHKLIFGMQNMLASVMFEIVISNVCSMP